MNCKESFNIFYFRGKVPNFVEILSSPTLSVLDLHLYSNKDENVHRYAVRGEKRERERLRKRDYLYLKIL